MWSSGGAATHVTIVGMSYAALTHLGPLLSRQFGIVTASQAYVLGVHRKALSRLADRGVLERVARGVYRSVSQQDSWEARALAAQLAAPSRPPLGFFAAGRLHDLAHVPGRRHPQIELLGPKGSWKPPGGISIREPTWLDHATTCEAGPFLLIDVTWTLASLASRLPAARLARAMDTALSNGTTSLRELRTATAQLRCCTGVPTLRAALELVAPVAMTRSEAERLFLTILGQAGLPLPEANVRVTDATGRRRYLDFAYTHWRIAIEIDVHPQHTRTVGRREDGARQNALVHEWIPLRFDLADLTTRPDQVVATVRALLTRVGALDD